MENTTYGNSRADRLVSYNVADFSVPQGTEEEWRFTPLERMEDFFDESFTGATPNVTITGQATVEKVAPGDPRLGKTLEPEDRVGAATFSSMSEAHVVTIARDTKLDEQVVITIEGTGSTEVAPLNILVVAEQFSESTVILNHTGNARLAEGVEIQVEDGAHLTFVTIQDWESQATHASSNRIRVGRDAEFKHIVVSLNGDLIRMNTSLDFAGEGANVNMLGAYFVDAGQHMEHRLFMKHNVKNCVSNASYKGALQGEDAQAVWVGDVLIEKVAEGTDTYEENRNLILTPGARADSIPNLEIETGEIAGGGHASATVRFDEEQLFYLQARGIEPKEARRLVIRGFFAELIQQIGVEAVEDKLMEAIEIELDLVAEAAA